MTHPIIDSLTLAEKKRDLDLHGYIVIPSTIPEGLCTSLCNSVEQSLATCAEEIGCTYEDYIGSASRWADPSVVTDACKEALLPSLRALLSLFLNHCELVKFNVISKTRHSSGPIPLHQDIAYSPKNPYQYSAWLALTDAPLESGPLEVIRGSHHCAIQSAIDFWDPDFKETSTPLHEGCEKIPVRRGDVIIFDSRLWHGSGSNTLNHERFAFVTRWVSPEYIPPSIPPISPAPFGMWTCKDKTQEILAQSWACLFEKPTDDFESLLNLWETALTENIFSFIPCQQTALLDLKRVRLLHEAHALHNGGDAQGLLYKSLWTSLLTPLKEILHDRTEPENPHRFPRVCAL